MEKQNLTLMTDLYELTMMQGYFRNKDRNETVIFDAFYRSNPMDSGYAVCAGLEQVSGSSTGIFSTISETSASPAIFTPFRKEA